jgi:uncharacterized membrane protein
MTTSNDVNVSSTDDLILRIGYLSTGSFCLYEGFQTWVRGQIELNPQVVVYCLAIYAVAFASMALAFAEIEQARKLKDFIPTSLLAVMLIAAYVLFQIHYRGAYRTDALAFTHYAADLFLEKGLNPYPLDLQDALYRFKVDPLYITLTPLGDISTNLAYPALHFLVFVPFVAVGLQDMRWVVFLFEVATAVVLYYNAPEELRPIILLPIFVSADLAIDFNAGSVTDFLWVLPMVMTALSMNDPFRSGIFYGIACAIKQQPWIVAPFMLIRMLNLKKGSLTTRASEVLKFIGAMAFSFSVPNLLFIVKDPGAWLSGVLTPASGELVLLSQGLSMITQAGIIALPPAFYFGVTAILFLTFVGNYFVYFDKLKHLIWLFPAVTMWFSHRALQNYFMFWIPVMVAEALALERRRSV